MSDIKPKKPVPTTAERIRGWVDFIFGFENKKGEVLDHSVAFSDKMQLAPSEFYDAIEREIAARKIPGLTISRTEFSEGGLLSEKRLYLRMFRERLALYICASPFGTDYFFSCRIVYVEALLRLWHILACLAFLGLVGGLLLKPLGMTFTIIALVALLFALAGVFRNAAGSAVGDLDAFLLKIPVVSTFYQQWFRNETYYRTDMRMAYLQNIPALVQAIAEEITAAKGAKLVAEYRNSPILGELFRRRRKGPEPEDF